jgi:predicted esterase
MGASLQDTLVAGFSSGCFMADQLIIAYPETFKCAGLMNGGMSGQNSAERKEEYKSSGKSSDELYQHTFNDIIEMQNSGLVGD